MSIGFNFDKQGVRLRPSETEARSSSRFRIVILGDFSGRRNRGECAPASISARPFYLVDPDTLNELPRKLNASLLLPVRPDSRSQIVLEFPDMESFHPDGLYDRVELFSELRKLRRQLDNPETFQKAARELMPEASPAASSSPQSKEPDETEAPPENLLDAAIGATETGSSTQPAKSEGATLAAAVIREAVAPYVLPAPDPRQPELIASVDESLAGVMRTLLHNPDFQALEANWRGLEFLLRRIETGTNLSIEIVDVSKQELIEDLQTAGESGNPSQLEALLKNSTTNRSEIRLLAACFQFGPDADEVTALGQLAAIGQTLRAPVLAGAGPTFFGCSDDEQFVSSDDWYEAPAPGFVPDANWPVFRRSPQATWLGLLAPRVLARLPYGRGRDAIEKFAFEEIPEPPPHAELLWGSACFPAIAVLGQLWMEGRPLSLAGERSAEFESMPFLVYAADGEQQVYPVAERELTERAAKRITSLGVSPVVSVRSRDAIQLPGLRSVAEPPAPLAFD
jgi:type VI secretion system protein ImpC